MDDRPQGLIRWQWEGYPQFHTDRRNLILHVLTVPLFLAGTVAVALSPLYRWLALGAVGNLLAVALQGRGHRLEPAPPLPFRGPFDVVARLFVEQWVTFPRFVLSGSFARAWRASDGTLRA